MLLVQYKEISSRQLSNKQKKVTTGSLKQRNTLANIQRMIHMCCTVGKSVKILHVTWKEYGQYSGQTGRKWSQRICVQALDSFGLESQKFIAPDSIRISRVKLLLRPLKLELLPEIGWKTYPSSPPLICFHFTFITHHILAKIILIPFQ